MEIRWEWFHERYSDGMLLARVVQYSTDSLCSEDDAAAVEAFFQKNPEKKIERTIAQSCEKIRANARWYARDADAVASWVKAK
ncbi:hypothetical protein CYMTET_27393 [Cymbomonas tetramitiformis]|uniref:ERAP1-like C-terminal domain-containing protein n=1 Tax=Cymbomonas tetramitiformis TaxID=36881 RepID=A0AAE0FRG7_9CHLO|nr:hypothetical protein CYMTET_27393 [Cymbomonas tetramitiformis]